MVRPWERTPIRKAKGMFAYRLRYMRREEQIAEDKQKRNVWQKANPSSISLKHFSIQLLSKHHLAWCFFLIRTKGIRSRSRVENSSGGRVFPANDQDAQFASRVESLNMFIHKFNTTSRGVFFLWYTHGNELPFAKQRGCSHAYCSFYMMF